MAAEGPKMCAVGGPSHQLGEGVHPTRLRSGINAGIFDSGSVGRMTVAYFLALTLERTTAGTTCH